MTLIKESHNVLHGLKVGYAIVVQLIVEKWPKKELESVISFFGQLGLVPSLKALNLPFDRDLVLRVADMTARSRTLAPLTTRWTSSNCGSHGDARKEVCLIWRAASLGVRITAGTMQKALRIVVGVVAVGLALHAADLATRDCRLAPYVTTIACGFGFAPTSACREQVFCAWRFWSCVGIVLALILYLTFRLVFPFRTTPPAAPTLPCAAFHRPEN